jgi:hypothetical protein
MAEVFGGESRFLAGNSFRNGAIFIALLVFMMALADAAFYISKLPPSWLWIVADLAIGAVIFGLMKIVGIPLARFERSEGGIDGENAVVAVLRQLPDQFAVFRNIKSGLHDDIDCSVVGPTGIYAVEVKSHKCKVGFDGQMLTRNGRLFEKDFLSQATREAAGLRRLIRSAAGDDAYVGAIIVFASPEAGVSFGGAKIRNVSVIGRDWLNGTITHGPDAHAIEPERVFKISSALSALVPDKDHEKKIARLERALSDGSIG